MPTTEPAQNPRPESLAAESAGGSVRRAAPDDKARFRRLSFLVPESLLAEVDEIAARDGSNRTEIFKKALRLFSYAHGKNQEGKSLFIGETPTEIETQVVPLW